MPKARIARMTNVLDTQTLEDVAMTELFPMPATGGSALLTPRIFPLKDVCLFLELLPQGPSLSSQRELCLHVTGMDGYEPEHNRMEGSFNNYLVWHHLMQLHVVMPVWEQVQGQYPNLTSSTTPGVQCPEDLSLLRPAMEDAFVTERLNPSWPVNLMPLDLATQADLATRFSDTDYRKACLRGVLQSLSGFVAEAPPLQ